MIDHDGFVERRFSAPDGLTLSARIYGEQIDGGLPVVCLPGLTRNARDFHDLAVHLSRNARLPRKIVAFDYRGRGQSAYDPDWKNYDLMVETGDVLAGLTALGIEHAAFIGTSRGGLIIFLLAAMRPAALRAVVLNDVGPVIEGAGLAQIRAYLERAPKAATFDEAAKILKVANGAAFPALADADWDRMAHAIYREDGGKLRPDFDPNLMKTLKGIDLSAPLPVFWPQFVGLGAVPVLAIRGETSMLLSPETLAQMRKRHSRIETITVAGQGHAPMLDTGDLPKRIEAFLDRTETTPVS
ncbi:alpha/beta hydrolase [Mesorhizobium sp. CAU 1732]|uniref:alpha/beta fold hydrolase n=1 Tax=Mesorhizobium sp. CAU 1732 TaxID=3140358 RepID=UPI00326178C9